MVDKLRNIFIIISMILAIDIYPGAPYTWGITAGVLDFASLNPNIELALPNANIARCPKLPRSEWDGLITQMPKERFSGTQVFISARAKGLGPTVCVNEKAIAELIVDQFIQMGLKHFAFVRMAASGIGDLRCHTYMDALSDACGEIPTVITMNDEPARAMASLPRPCGVMAANDHTGEQFLRLCKTLDVRVPGEVNVIAVDNTPICMDTQPTLSSVDIPFSWIGYRAAELCTRLVRGEWAETEQLVEPTGIILRGSITSPGSGLDAAASVAHFIRTHLDEPIIMEDIMRQHTMSRRRMEQIFHETYGTSPMAYLKSLRLDRAKNMLRKTTLNLDEIAVKCGYPDANRLCRAFRTKLGTTPMRYRKGVGS